MKEDLKDALKLTLDQACDSAGNGLVVILCFTYVGVVSPSLASGDFTPTALLRPSGLRGGVALSELPSWRLLMGLGEIDSAHKDCPPLPSSHTGGDWILS